MEDRHDEDISDAAYRIQGVPPVSVAGALQWQFLMERCAASPASVEGITETMDNIITAFVLAAGGNPRTVLHFVYPVGGKDHVNKWP